MSAGQQLRRLRESLGLTIRDVEEASAAIAGRRGSDEYSIGLSRLSDIEKKDIVPGLHKLYSLAVIYRSEYRELLKLYDIDLDNAVEDLAAVAPALTHRIAAGEELSMVEMPVKMDPGFNPKSTTNLGRMVEEWGVLPTAFLKQHAKHNYAYGYVGTEDLTMFPLIMPGSFLQIDEQKNEVAEGGWKSEYERPIYFIETRGGFLCSWCSVQKEQLIVQPHPLSPVQPRVYKFASEADVLGQVVGVAMRLPSALPAALPSR